MFIDVLCWWFIGDISMDVPWTKAWCHIKSAEPYPAYANPYPLLIAFVGCISEMMMMMMLGQDFRDGLKPPTRLIGLLTDIYGCSDIPHIKR